MVPLYDSKTLLYSRVRIKYLSLENLSVINSTVYSISPFVPNDSERIKNFLSLTRKGFPLKRSAVQYYYVPYFNVCNYTTRNMSDEQKSQVESFITSGHSAMGADTVLYGTCKGRVD